MIGQSGSRRIKRIVSHPAVQNAGWLIAGRVAQMLLSLFVSLLTARYLGPSNYGLIGYASAYTAFFTSFCTLGINSLLVKEFVDRPGAEGEILGTALLLKAGSSVLSAAAMVGIVSVVDRDEPTTVLVVALSGVGVLVQIFETFHYWFQARLASKVTALATFAAYCVTSAYRVFLIVTGKSVAYFALATSVDYICIAIFLAAAYRKRGGGKLSVSWQYGRQLLGKSHHFILSGLMVSLYGQTDKLMLKQMVGTVEIGYYSTAVALSNMWCFVLHAVIKSMYPSIMEAAKREDGAFEQRNKQLYAIVFYLSVFVSLGFAAFGPRIIDVLYGAAYLPAAAPLRIVTWYTAFSYLGVARDAWVVCRNCQKYLKYIYLMAACSNVLLNLLLIPPFGASGAAMASLITQILTILAPACVKEMRVNTKWILEAIAFKGVFPGKPESR